MRHSRPGQAGRCLWQKTSGCSVRLVWSLNVHCKTRAAATTTTSLDPAASCDMCPVRSLIVLVPLQYMCLVLVGNVFGQQHLYISVVTTT